MLVLAGIAVASAIGVVVTVNAATTAHSSDRTTPVVSSTSTTIPPFVDDGSLTAPHSYRGGLIMLAPPAIGTRPRVTASEAFADRGGYAWRKEPPMPHLALAIATISDYGASSTDGTVTPFIDHRLVWVVTYTNVPPDDVARVGGVRATTTSSARPAPGYTVLSFVDAATGNALGARGFADEPRSGKCVPVRIVGTSYVSPKGKKSNLPSPGAATIYHFADGNQQLVVPIGFDPLKADDLTLFLFGFPPRPQDPAALARWIDNFRDYRASVPVGESICKR